MKSVRRAKTKPIIICERIIIGLADYCVYIRRLGNAQTPRLQLIGDRNTSFTYYLILKYDINPCRFFFKVVLLLIQVIKLIDIRINV